MARDAALVVFIVFVVIALIAYAGGRMLSAHTITPPPAPLVSTSSQALASPLPSGSVYPNDATAEARIDSMNNPESVVVAFSEDFFKSGPPVSDLASAQEALGLLTVRAKQQVMNSSTSNSLSSGLLKFAGVKNTPNDGVNVAKAVIDANHAHVEANWNYPDGTTTKTFYLVKDNGVWKIDLIK